ncbi:MAG: FG-GAP-like repeat-containing protein [Deltaproteobacteria bacterium]|nr:FG-GAP-like repeat-containing protein [Deltaproteobacteria bacterium]
MHPVAKIALRASLRPLAALALSLWLVHPTHASAQTLDQVAQTLAQCVPTGIAGLSHQIFATFQCHHPGYLVPIEPGHGVVGSGGVYAPLRMYLRPDARARLYRLGARGTISVTETFRTVADQHLYFLAGRSTLSSCLSGPLPGGQGRHETGVALDVNGGDALASRSGGECCRAVSGDPVHFECRPGCAAGTSPSDGTDLMVRVWGVQAFQLLWNANHPTDRIATDGVFGTATETRLRASPAGGFLQGACEPDRDADGYPESRDCNDTNPAIHPNATETCNALDDDCDGQIDEDITRACGSLVGACRAGSQSCQTGTWGACTGSVQPSAETCDGVDNDCDGETDEESVCALEAASLYSGSGLDSTDVDGDGRADACALTAQGVRCLLANGHGFEGVLDAPIAALVAEPRSEPLARLSQTLRMGDLDGDHRADLCAADDRAVRCWRLNPRGQPELLGTVLTASPVTNLLMVNADGDPAHTAELCLRSREGLRCYRLGSREFALISQLDALSDDAGFGDPARYGTLRMGDLDGDRRADVCARAPEGVRCWRAAPTGFLAAEQGPAWSDALGWDAVSRWSSIRLADVNGDGRAELCARQPSETFVCHAWANGAFAMGTDGPSLTAAHGWDNASTYNTLMLADVDGDGSLDLCARETEGIRCWLHDRTNFSRLLQGPRLSDLEGWSEPSAFRSIRLGDVTGDGLVDLCARAPTGLRCYVNTSGSFAGLLESGQWTDAQSADPRTLSNSLRIAGPAHFAGMPVTGAGGCRCAVVSGHAPAPRGWTWLFSGLALLALTRRGRAKHRERQPIAHTVSLAVGLAASALGCDTGAVDPITAPSLCERLAREVCAVERQCCRAEPMAVPDVLLVDASSDASDARTDSATRPDVLTDAGARADGSDVVTPPAMDASTVEGTCETEQRVACEQTLGQMTQDPRITYVPTAAGALVASLRATAESCRGLAGPRDVRRLFAGTSAERAGCSPTDSTTRALATAQASCTTPTTCRLTLRADGASVGICEPRGRDDLACSHPLDCAQGLHCVLGADWQPSQWGRCEPPAADGTLCTSDAACESAFCNAMGRCEQRTPAAFCLTQRYPQQVLLERPELYLRLSDSPPRAALDSSGASQNGTYQGTPAREPTGALAASDDGAVLLDGTSAWLAAPLAMQQTRNAGFAIELWVRTRGTTGRRPIIELFDANRGAGFNLWTEGTTLTADFVGIDGASHRVIAPEGLLVAGQWTYVVATFDGALGRLFIDGQLSAQIAATTLQIRGELRLGHRAATAPAMTGGMGTPASYLSGALDEVAIYGHTLPAQTVRRHYLAGVNGRSMVSSPVFRWLE